MPRNIEIKARLSDPDLQRKIAASLSQFPAEIIYQEDVFFRANYGRLKLRFFSDGSGELISYTRQDLKGPKSSKYFIFKTDNPNDLKNSLADSLGILKTVKKKRELYITGRTRIHIDKVEQLGDFLELEVVLNENENPADGKREANELMKKLHISHDQLVDKAYVDLLNEITK